MNGRSRMTIDPGMPTTPGRSTSGFTDQADIARTKPDYFHEAIFRCDNISGGNAPPPRESVLVRLDLMQVM